MLQEGDVGAREGMVENLDGRWGLLHHVASLPAIYMSIHSYL
jgi:hypothetical protein